MIQPAKEEKMTNRVLVSFGSVVSTVVRHVVQTPVVVWVVTAVVVFGVVASVAFSGTTRETPMLFSQPTPAWAPPEATLARNAQGLLAQATAAREAASTPFCTAASRLDARPQRTLPQGFAAGFGALTQGGTTEDAMLFTAKQAQKTHPLAALGTAEEQFADAFATLTARQAQTFTHAFASTL
jgi:hypothetical protein